MTNDKKTALLSWRIRLSLLLVAIAATAAYAASFLLLPGATQEQLLRLAAVIALAAALSWPVFGISLLIFSPESSRPSPLCWADICLRTMLRGNTVLGASILLNLAGGIVGAEPSLALATAHLAILLAANITMARFFAAQAKLVSMPPAKAIFGWIAGLNLPFILILFALWKFT